MPMTKEEWTACGASAHQISAEKTGALLGSVCAPCAEYEALFVAPQAAAYTPRKKTLFERLRAWWEDFEDSRRVPVTEADKETIASWYAKAREMRTPGQLARFVETMRSRYRHDYGTICHAVAASAVAAAWCVDRGPTGGITGFQAGAIFWEFARAWRGIEGDARLLEFDNMLFPQYEERFDKTLALDTWQRLQAKAAKELKANGDRAHPEVVAHWESIIAGKVPFGYRVEVKAAP